MKALPLPEATSRLIELADEVSRTQERVLITRDGRNHVVLMSVDDLASLEATIETLRDHGAMARIGEAERSVAEGSVVTSREMDRLMADRARREARNA